MAAAFTLFYFWLLSWLGLISLVYAENPQQFAYNGFRGANLHLDGNAKIHSSGLLQLTNTSKQVAGYAFYPSPISFETSSSTSAQSLSFSTRFVIAMVPEFKDVSGHGIAFVISQSMDFSHAVQSQYLGLFNNTNNGNSLNHVFAVEFDTIRDPVFNEIDNNHVGIDVNGLISNRSAPAAYFSNEVGKDISLRLISGRRIQIWIDYTGEKLLNVTLAPMGIPKPIKPLLSTQIDLSDVLLDTMYVGFSASTGSIASNHYILGWSFSRTGQAQSLEISKLPRLPKARSRIKPNQLKSIIAAVFLVMTISGATYFYRLKKYEEVREEWEKEYGPQRLSYKTLYKATKGFQDKHLLGSGGFGKVYKGKLPSLHGQIAVKKVSHKSKQGMKEFVSEIVIMGRLKHRNLVPLIGYCRRKKELILVYDYMPNGSLDKYLFHEDRPNLDWPQRFQIIKGVASALLYLHEGGEKTVLHRDIKASNVLLDSNFNGRLADFGLARLYDHDADPQTTRLVGTLGYLDPELTRTGKATKSSDVFSFGTFLLEVACGRKPIDPNLQSEDIFLIDLVGRCWKSGAILDASDHRLHGHYVAHEMEKILKLGLLCCNSKLDQRPNIKEVVQYLDGNAGLPDIPPDNAVSSLPFSSIHETLPSDSSIVSNIAIHVANNLPADRRISFSSSVGTVSENTFSSTDTILHVGR